MAAWVNTVSAFVVTIIWLLILVRFTTSKFTSKFTLLCLATVTATVVSATINALTSYDLFSGRWNYLIFLLDILIYHNITICVMMVVGRRFYPPWAKHTLLYRVSIIFTALFDIAALTHILVFVAYNLAEPHLSLSAIQFGLGMGALIIAQVYSLRPLMESVRITDDDARNSGGITAKAAAVVVWYMVGVTVVWLWYLGLYVYAFADTTAYNTEDPLFPPWFIGLDYITRTLFILFITTRPSRRVVEYLRVRMFRALSKDDVSTFVLLELV